MICTKYFLEIFLCLQTILCREHSWQSSAPFWDNKKKHVRKNKKFNYRKHVDVSNKTLVQLLDNFTFISAWKLPPFNVHHVMIKRIISILSNSGPDHLQVKSRCLQVLSNSISISDSGGLDLSRHYNCNIPPPPPTMKLFYDL